MSWKQKHTEIQLRLTLKQNRKVLFFLLLWLAFSALALLGSGHSPGDTLAVLFFCKRSDTNFGFFYESMTDFVVFGLVVSVFLVDMRRRIRPEIACSVMARELADHAVIFHYSNLGRRTHQLFRKHDIPVAVVEPAAEKLSELVRDGFPCLQASGRSSADIEAVNVAAARFVLVAADDLESSAIICSHVRKANPDCDLVVRCFEDDIGERIGKRYRATVISTSGVATRYVQRFAAQHRLRKAIVVGGGTLTRRMIAGLLEDRLEVTVITERPDQIEDLIEEHQFVEGLASDPAVLEMAEADEADLLIVAEENLELALTTVDEVRGINPKCKIICRLFHDDAACVLTDPPYNCEILSTSRQTVEQLRQQGAFAALGLPGSSSYSPPASDDEGPSVSRRAHKSLRSRSLSRTGG